MFQYNYTAKVTDHKFINLLRKDTSYLSFTTWLGCFENFFMHGSVITMLYGSLKVRIDAEIPACMLLNICIIKFANVKVTTRLSNWLFESTVFNLKYKKCGFVIFSPVCPSSYLKWSLRLMQVRVYKPSAISSCLSTWANIDISNWYSILILKETRTFFLLKTNT